MSGVGAVAAAGRAGRALAIGDGVIGAIGRLAALPDAELETLMVRGETPDAAALCGWEYAGANTPPWAGLVGIRKFIKGFDRDGAGRLFGYNRPVVQDGLGAPWRARPRARRFGFYQVEPVSAAARDNAYLHALLLDYGRGANPAADPSRTLRDYLVRVEPGRDDLLLGKALVALGPLRLPVSYFVLARLRPAPAA